MKQRLLFILLGLIVLVLAVGGWVVEGARWALTGSRDRLAPATA